MNTKRIEISIGQNVGSVSAILDRPADARAVLALAHGAGAGMRHPFMESMAARLAARDVATFRYHFPYMERGDRRPDPPGVLVATVRAAVARAGEEGLSVFAGGKSLGGRMTSTAASASPAESTQPMAGVKGIVFFGFPLHAPGRPSSDRAEHLERVTIPMLFLQGTRDALAHLDLLRPIVQRLGRRASLHVVEDADHSFRIPKRSGRTSEMILDEIADATGEWIEVVSSASLPRS